MGEERGWQEFVAGQEVLVVMRFSYFGVSGWQGDASKRKEALLDPARLAVRLGLLERLALPSLAAQEDRNFHLMVLCSEDMPAPEMTALREMCAAGLEAGRHTIAPRPHGRAQKHVATFMRQRYGTGRVIQTVLDDDDAFACDLVGRARVELAQLPEPEGPEALRFVSFADGYGLDVTGEGARLYGHRYPYLNLGLTMVAMATGKNILSIAHQKTPKEHPSRLIKGVPMFVRSLHGTNDSRIAVTDRWKEIEGWREDAALARRFPFLPALGG